MKVLMVDDEATILLYYKAELQDEGYEVITASTGERAIELFQQERPDVVTLDIVMPEISGGYLKSSPDPVGVQILRHMKFIDDGVPILMLSAYDFNDNMKDLPSDGYIMKSSDTTELKKALRKIARARHN